MMDCCNIALLKVQLLLGLGLAIELAENALLWLLGKLDLDLGRGCCFYLHMWVKIMAMVLCRC